MKSRPAMSTGRRWAYGGAALGVSLSVAANVEHVLVQGRETAPGAVVSAAACPVILLVALEVIARTTWPAGLRWVLLRWLALPTVAVVAASISYLHMRSLLLVYGESTWAATVGPLAVDGLMAVAVGALLVPFDELELVEPAGALVDVRAGNEHPAGGARALTAAVDRTPLQQVRPRATRPRRTTTVTTADAGRAAVLDALAVTPMRQAELVRATGLARRTVRDHLAALLADAHVTRSGQTFIRVTGEPSSTNDVTPASGVLETSGAGAR